MVRAGWAVQGANGVQTTALALLALPCCSCYHSSRVPDSCWDRVEDRASRMPGAGGGETQERIEAGASRASPGCSSNMPGNVAHLLLLQTAYSGIISPMIRPLSEPIGAPRSAIKEGRFSRLGEHPHDAFAVNCPTAISERRTGHDALTIQRRRRKRRRPEEEGEEAKTRGAAGSDLTAQVRWMDKE